MEITGHAQAGFILDGAQMSAVERECLNAAVSAVGHCQYSFSARINPYPVRGIELSVAVSWLADLTQEFSSDRKTEHVARAVAVAHVKIAVGSERDICGHEVDGPLRIILVFSRIAMYPNFLAGEGGLYHPAAVDIAMVEKFGLTLAAQFQSVRPASKALAKRTNEAAFLLEDNNRFAAHARLVDGVTYIDMALLVLAEPVRISPHQPFGRDQPIVDALVGVRAGTQHRKARARLVRSLETERRQSGRQPSSRACFQE